MEYDKITTNVQFFNPDQCLSHDAPITFKGSTDDNQDVSFTRTGNGQTLSNDVNLDQQPYFDSAPTLNNDITEVVVGGKTTVMVYNGKNGGTRMIWQARLNKSHCAKDNNQSYRAGEGT